MSPLAAASASSHGAHVLHLVQASGAVLLALVAVGLAEHLRGRVSPALAVLCAAGGGSAAIHYAVTPSHWQQAPVYGAFFLVAATAQLGYSLLLIVRPLRGLVTVAVLGNAAILLLWVQTRTLGVPLGPEAGRREAVGVLDLTAAALELVVVVVGLVMLRARQRTASESVMRSQPFSAAGLPPVMHSSS